MENFVSVSVSVIIPCYCCSHTIVRAVESVFNQTFRPIEVILVDDGSKDDTPVTLQKLQTKYDQGWIKLILLEKNSGPSFARNIAWDSALGDYIAFLDADDAWHPEKIEIQYLWMQEHSDVLVCGHTAMLRNSVADQESQINRQFKIHKVTNEEILSSNPFVTPSVMLKKNISYRFDTNKRYCEDYLLWMKIGLDEHPMYMLDVKLTYIFNNFGKSGLTRNLMKMRIGHIENYLLLHREQKINFTKTYSLIIISLFKHFTMLVLGVKTYDFLKKALIKINYFHQI